MCSSSERPDCRRLHSYHGSDHHIKRRTKRFLFPSTLSVVNLGNTCGCRNRFPFPYGGIPPYGGGIPPYGGGIGGGIPPYGGAYGPYGAGGGVLNGRQTGGAGRFGNFRGGGQFGTYRKSARKSVQRRWLLRAQYARRRKRISRKITKTRQRLRKERQQKVKEKAQRKSS